MMHRPKRATLLVSILLVSITTAYKQCPESQWDDDLDSFDGNLQIYELVNILKSKSVCKNSCLNGGTRIDLFNGRYVCNCVPGFTGIICETESQSVCKNSCLNGGIRFDLFNGEYICDCVSGFTGIICETPTYLTETHASTTDMSKMNEMKADVAITDPTASYVTETNATTTDMSTMKEMKADVTITDPTATYVTETNATTTDMSTMNEMKGDVTITDSIGCTNGSWYTGTQTRTITNKACQRWDSQTPHRHTYTNAGDYDGKIKYVSQAENYCRNPDKKRGHPWCFTTDPKKRWEFCNIKFCNGCRHTETGAEYTGTLSMISAYQLPCLRWDSITRQLYTPAQFSGGIKTLSQAQNYCRNPDKVFAGPWCYISTSEPALTCSVPFCHGCFSIKDGGYYDGTKSTTKSGLTCQRWDRQSPHPHSVSNPLVFKVSKKYKLTHVNEAENYCRVVDGFSRKMPWCFTTASGTEWEDCGVPVCPFYSEYK